MPRSKSSKRWLDQHFKDPYVIRAQKEGHRSRAAFKLLEMHEKYKLIKPGMLIVDLGAAPGGWTVVAKDLLGDKGEVIALDILPMDEVPGIHFIQGDFSEPETLGQLLRYIDNRPVDLVMSDMAPNISGIGAVDQPRAMYLSELALDLAKEILKPGGNFLVKVFQGEGIDPYLASVRQAFKQVKIRKPKASRPQSREVYLLGMGFKGIMQQK